MHPLQVTKVNTLTGHRDCIYTLARSSEPSIIFSASGDGMIAQWDLTNPENGTLVAKVPRSVYSLLFHEQSGLLIAGQNFEGIHLLDWRNKTEVSSLKLGDAAIFDLQPLGDVLYAALGDGVLIAIDLKNLAIIRRVKHSEKSARTIAIHPQGKFIVVGYSDNYIRVFDSELNLLHEWIAHTNSVFTLKFIPGTEYLVSGSRDARLKVWDMSGKQMEEVVAHLYAINHIEFSPDGKHFVTCSMDKSMKVWDLETFRLLKVVDRSRHAGHGTSVNKLLWTSFNNQLLSASDDRTISIWHIIF